MCNRASLGLKRGTRGVGEVNGRMRGDGEETDEKSGGEDNDWSIKHMRAIFLKN